MRFSRTPLVPGLVLCLAFLITDANAQPATPSATQNSPAAAVTQPIGNEPEVKPPAADKATIYGVVRNETGLRLIEHAHVVLTNVKEQHKRLDLYTNDEGHFVFEDIQPGNWSLTATAKDMHAKSVSIQVKPNDLKQVDINLEDIEEVDTLRVTGKRTLIHPEKIGSETNLDHKFIYQYKSGNDLKELITSTPGVMNDSFGNIITRGEHNAINYVVDGVVIPEAAGVLQQSQPISPRSLQSMKVDIGGYEASDGGGPLGAVAHMTSLPILPKSNFNVGQQIGGPLAGNIFYNGSSAFSQNTGSKLYNLRIESSGSFRGTSYRLAPPTENYVNDKAADISSFTKIEYRPTEQDVLRLSAAVNHTFTQIPTSVGTRNAGFNASQHDAQDYLILSYIHRFRKFFDQLNLHAINGFYYQKFNSSSAFDPYPNFNSGQPLYSIAARANRFNYIFSAQGNLTKTINKEHHFKTGFLSEVRPVKTSFNAIYFNADALTSFNQQAAGRGEFEANTQEIAAASEAGDIDTVNALLANPPINANPFPFGALISPYTGQIGGPQFLGPVGKFKGFRFLQSAYFQDRYTPQKGFWKRLTLDAGARFDLQRSYYGNTLPLASTIAAIPGVQPFSLQPYQAQTKTDAQVSGRYGGTFVIAKNTVLRGSYSDLFIPNPVDIFITPYQVVDVDAANGVNAYGIFDGTPRPLRATRGRLVDTSVEQQIGPRFATRTNFFYKYLTNFGDSGVVGNLPLYNRLTNSAQEAYGVETRLDLKSSKDGYGFNGFLSNTVQVAYLRKSKNVTGGFYTNPAPPGEPGAKFPDHDRRYQMVAGIGYKTRRQLWALLSVQTQTGLQDQRDPNFYGPHKARTPVFTNVSLSMGYQPTEKIASKFPLLPNAFDVRVDNMLNQRVPINLGSPFQGTRFSLPVRVLAGCSWQLGPQQAKLSAKPAPNSIRLNI